MYPIAIKNYYIYMTISQIFKNPIPNNAFFELLDKICIKHDTYYLYNGDSFKKGMFNGTIPDFVEFCAPYYHLSKRKYLNKKQTCNSFTTIVRQICNNNNISYTYKIKYDKNSYDIWYQIYFA